MNGYEVMSQCYRKAVDNDQIDPDEGSRKIRIFDFLASCDQSDIFALFDSSAFNDIVKAYVRRIADDMTEEGEIIEEIADSMKQRISWLLDGVNAENILK